MKRCICSLIILGLLLNLSLPAKGEQILRIDDLSTSVGHAWQLEPLSSFALPNSIFDLPPFSRPRGYLTDRVSLRAANQVRNQLLARNVPPSALTQVMVGAMPNRILMLLANVPNPHWMPSSTDVTLLLSKRNRDRLQMMNNLVAMHALPRSSHPNWQDVDRETSALPFKAQSQKERLLDVIYLWALLEPYRTLSLTEFPYDPPVDLEVLTPREIYNRLSLPARLVLFFASSYYNEHALQFENFPKADEIRAEYTKISTLGDLPLLYQWLRSISILLARRVTKFRTLNFDSRYAIQCSAEYGEYFSQLVATAEFLGEVTQSLGLHEHALSQVMNAVHILRTLPKPIS